MSDKPIYKVLENQIHKLEEKIIKHKETENTLKETEKLYQFAVEYSNDGFALSDQGVIVSVNQKFLNIFGYDHADEVINQPISNFIHPDDQEEVLKRYERRQRGEKVTSQYEFRGIRKDGQILDIEVSSKAATYKGKKLNIAYLSDISERKKSKKEISESQERYRSLFDHMSDGVAIYKALDNGEDFIFVDFNHAGEKIESIDKAHLIGKRVTQVFPGVKEFGILDVFKQVWKTGKPQHHPISMYKDNRISGWRDNYVYKLPTGEVVAIYSDETEKKIAHEALKKSEREKRAILQGITAGIQLVNKDLEILWLNRAASSLIQKSPDDMIGKKCYEVMCGRDRICEDCPIENVFKYGKSEQISRYNEDGRIRSLKFEPVYDDSNQVVGVIEISNDITEKIHLETQLRQAQKMEAIGTLAGGIAHDFNNILSSILGFTEIAKIKFGSGEDIEKDLNQVLNAGIRARDLVKHLLVFSRQTDIEKTGIEICPLIKESLKFLRASLPATVEIRQIITDQNVMVLADPTQIHQILMNLCANAAHAMKDTGGILDVRLKEVILDDETIQQYKELMPGKYIRLTVSDTGHGISKEYIERIFDPFFTTKKRGEGTGMGLSLIHGIIMDMGGALSVYSEPGKGTTFHVLFPKLEGKADRLDHQALVIKKGEERILFVDDEEGVVATSRGILKKLGYEVVTATNGFDALKIFNEDPDKFDLVITDATMPKMTGLELSKRLIEIREDIPIILCTGFSAGVTTEKIKEYSIRELVMKPMIVSELAEAVRRAINSKSE